MESASLLRYKVAQLLMAYHQTVENDTVILLYLNLNMGWMKNVIIVLTSHSGLLNTEFIGGATNGQILVHSRSDCQRENVTFRANAAFVTIL